MLLFFAGGLVGADKHLSQRVSLIASMTLTTELYRKIPKISPGLIFFKSHF